MNHAHKKQQGFTLVELSLAMAFISILLLAIAMTIIQIGAIYNQGTIAKDVNQLSREINVDLDRTISASGTLDLSTSYVRSPASATAATADGGRLCLGSYSYIWNYSKAIESNADGVTKYIGREGNIQLIKVADPAQVYCLKNTSTGVLVNRNILATDAPKAQELLKVGDRQLGLHSFVFANPPTSATDISTGQKIYSLSYIIGTSKTSALNTNQTACLVAGAPNADPLYCKIQKFNLVVRTGNGVN